MKILLSHRYFWPDSPPYGTMLRSIAARLAQEKHDVTVFSTQPSYLASSDAIAPATQQLDGFRVVRMPTFKERKGIPPLRLVNALAYAAGLRRHILHVGDYSLVTAATFPPILAARAAEGAAHRIGARFIYHCMDLHPEVSLYSGQLSDGFLFSQLRSLDSRTCRRADALVVLSEDMAATLRGRPGNAALSPEIINNFALDDFAAVPTGDTPKLPEDKFTILFAGNIGRFQSLETIIAAAHRLSDLQDVQFWFMGEGVAKKGLIEQAGRLVDRTVFFVRHQLHSVAQEWMGRASLNLVSLQPGIHRVAYPSKTLSIISRGGPILAAIEPTSELARMVLDADIGYVVDQTDPRAIAATVRRAYAERGRGPALRANVQRLHAARFDKDRVLDRWCELVARLSAGKRSWPLAPL